MQPTDKPQGAPQGEGHIHALASVDYVGDPIWLAVGVRIALEEVAVGPALQPDETLFAFLDNTYISSLDWNGRLLSWNLATAYAV